MTRSRSLALRFASLAGIGSTFVAASAGARQFPGRELYQSACAACHGTDGRGAPRAVVGFDTPLPDFTDCSFATPEADADWLAISHGGGPARGFDRRMPAFGEALSTEELLAVIGHIRTFCSDSSWPRGELNLPRALVTEKAFPENEAVLTTTWTTRGAASMTNEFLYERRLGSRSQFEVTVPVNLQEQDAGDWGRGLGDVALALKRVLFHDLDRGSIASVSGEVVFPTGKEQSGLGSGVTRFEPFLTFGQILSMDSFLQFQGGAELSSDTRRAAHEGFWRLTAGRTFFGPNFGRAWSPMIELLGAREFGATDDASSTLRVEWDAVPQVQLSLSRRQHVLLNVGIRVPLNNRDERRVRVITYLLWDWFDGGLFTGWR